MTSAAWVLQSLIGFWLDFDWILAVHVFIIHQLEKKHILKMIPMILFPHVIIVIAVMRTSLFS